MTREKQPPPVTRQRVIAAAMVDLQRWRENGGEERPFEKLGRIHGLMNRRTHGTKRG